MINKSKFSEHAGVSRVAVTLACKKGALVVRPDGKLETDNPVNKDYVNRHKNRPKKKKTIKQQQVEREPEKPPFQSDIKLTDISSDRFDEFLSQLSAINRGEIEALKILEHIKRERIKSDKERNELISRDRVAKFFGKLYQIDVQELRTLGPNLAPEIIAAISDIQDDDGKIIKIEELIEKEVFIILQHIKRVINEHLLRELEAVEIE